MPNIVASAASAASAVLIESGTTSTNSRTVRVTGDPRPSPSPWSRPAAPGAMPPLAGPSSEATDGLPGPGPKAPPTSGAGPPVAVALGAVWAAPSASPGRPRAPPGAAPGPGLKPASGVEVPGTVTPGAVPGCSPDGSAGRPWGPVGPGFSGRFGSSTGGSLGAGPGSSGSGSAGPGSGAGSDGGSTGAGSGASTPFAWGP